MKTPKQLWPDIANGNHQEARVARRNRLNALRSRVADWMEVLANHPDGGPTRAELAGIVADLKTFIDREVAPE